MRPPGLRDVAAQAGVSVKTVSNVVNGTGRVTDATRARVEAAVAALGYRPNVAARNLRRGRTGVITLALPDLTAPYFAELADAMIRVAEPRSLTVLIDQTQGSLERELRTFRGELLQQSDGLVFSPLAMPAEELARRTEGVPLVLLGEHVPSGLHDRVVVDNRAAAALATRHLISLGRQSIAAIGPQPRGSHPTSQLRLDSFRQTLAEHGMSVEPAMLAPVESFHRADGAQAMNRLLSHRPRPDAVFCFNDLLALGAMRAAHDHGLRVPEDIAVIGFDGIEEGAFSTPTLSTITLDKRQIAEAALALLASRTETPDLPARTVTVDHRLAVRASTGGPSVPHRVSGLETVW
ncbi:LacI family DNA-binding transcriptional regulator [Streptomyces sp. NPDC086766]|uniref:LacI family DNA-binding transcriptional regulator n=1 Tax=Streptomyces sp. NPDC086766 TaxID=3365754 RepID=UPI003821DC96